MRKISYEGSLGISYLPIFLTIALASGSRPEAKPKAVQRLLRQQRVHHLADEAEAPIRLCRGAGPVCRASTMLGESRCAGSQGHQAGEENRLRGSNHVPDHATTALVDYRPITD